MLLFICNILIQGRNNISSHDNGKNLFEKLLGQLESKQVNYLLPIPEKHMKV